MSLIFCIQNKQIDFQGNHCSPQAEAALGSQLKQVLTVLKTLPILMDSVFSWELFLMWMLEVALVWLIHFYLPVQELHFLVIS